MTVFKSATLLCDDCEISSLVEDTAAQVRARAKREGWSVTPDRCPQCRDARSAR